MRFERRKRRRIKTKLTIRRRKIFIFKFVFLIILTIILIILAVWFFRLELTKITSILVFGNEITQEEKLVGIADKYLEGEYFYLIPKSNIFLYPKDKIKEEIFFEFPRIKDVNIEYKNLHTISIEVFERKPLSLYCGKDFVEIEENTENCYFMDEEGILFSKAPDFSGNIFFKYFGDLDVKPKFPHLSPLGSRYMNIEKFRGFRLFIESFQDLNIKPITLNKNDEFDFTLLFEDGTKIIFRQDQELAMILDNLESVLEAESIKNTNKQLDYIDLRFGNKIYYKFE